MLCFEYPSKQLILRSPNSKEYPEILKLYFEYFLKDEPGSKSRGGYPLGIPLKVKDDIIKYLNEDLSLVAVDSTNDQIFISKCSRILLFFLSGLFKNSRLTVNFQTSSKS